VKKLIGTAIIFAILLYSPVTSGQHDLFYGNNNWSDEAPEVIKAKDGEWRPYGQRYAIIAMGGHVTGQHYQS
jgi:hypothetical protein